MNNVTALKKVEQPVVLNNAERRATLKEAIARRDAARIECQRAAATVERGKQLHDKTRADLAELGNVGGEITKHLANSVKDAARQGSACRQWLCRIICSCKRNARDEQLEKVASAAVAVSSLEVDHEEASGTLQEADRAVSACAVAVIIEEACGLGLRLKEARREAANLTAQLQLLAGFWGPFGRSGNFASFPLPYALVSLLNEPVGLFAELGS